MKYVYLDASSGVSGDMCLGALLDLGVDPALFKEKMAGLAPARGDRRPARPPRRFRRPQGRRRDQGPRAHERTFADVERIILKSRFWPRPSRTGPWPSSSGCSRPRPRSTAGGSRRPISTRPGPTTPSSTSSGRPSSSRSWASTDVYCSPLNVGSGWVKTSHGRPGRSASGRGRAPEEGARSTPAWVESELVTPTGAAIVATLAKRYLKLPELVYDKIGRGAGAKEFPEIPNILRVYLRRRRGVRRRRRASSSSRRRSTTPRPSSWPTSWSGPSRRAPSTPPSPPSS